MQVWVYTLSSVCLVSLISLVGVVTLALRKNLLEKILLFLVSFAVGGLFGDALIHLIPQAFEKLDSRLASVLIISGVLAFFALEKFLRWRHCHISERHDHIHPV